MSPAKEKIASHSFPKDFSRTVGKGTERICELTKDIFECLQTGKDQTKVLFSGYFLSIQGESKYSFFLSQIYTTFGVKFSGLNKYE